MSELFESALVEKRNVLNELRSNNMSLQELRFFSIYLSKINPFDISTRVVQFPLNDFRKIMDFGKLNIGQLKACTDSLLSKVVHIPDETGGYTAFTIFKKCRVFRNENEEWFMEINASDDALPLMFNFKSHYFKYELWNALRLKSANQIRMYEILKQYEKVGRRELTINELRELLGIEKNEYSRFERFRVRVLDSCQQALAESTDICYTYERGKTGKGGKWLTIIFHIQKNTSYKDPLSLSEFIEMKSEELNSDEIVIDSSEFADSQLSLFDECFDDYNVDDDEEIDYGSNLANLLGEAACGNEFSVEQIQVIKGLVLEYCPSADNLERCNYLKRLVDRMNYYETRQPIKNRFAYLCKMIEEE